MAFSGVPRAGSDGTHQPHSVVADPGRGHQRERDRLRSRILRRLRGRRGPFTIFFTLRGSFDPLTRRVQFKKVYERPVPPTDVTYDGRLHALNGTPEITGTWDNPTQGTSGTFSCICDAPRVRRDDVCFDHL